MVPMRWFRSKHRGRWGFGWIDTGKGAPVREVDRALMFLANRLQIISKASTPEVSRE